MITTSYPADPVPVQLTKTYGRCPYFLHKTRVRYSIIYPRSKRERGLKFNTNVDETPSPVE